MITSEMFIERLLLTKDIVRRREAVVQAAEWALQPLNETGILDMFGSILHSRGEIIERFRLPETEYLKEEKVKVTLVSPKEGMGLANLQRCLTAKAGLGYIPGTCRVRFWGG